MTQAQELLHYLKERGSITPLEALQELGIFRLAARIHDLERAGHSIPRETVKVTGRRNGRVAHITRYLRPD